MFYEFMGQIPVVHPSSFVHPQAVVTGNVVIGKNCYIGPCACVRGDWGKIIIEDGCNVQENCTIHTFPRATTLLQAGAHMGHGSIVHGATIGINCMIGMNAVIMDNAVIGKDCIIGALAFVNEGVVITDRSVMVGNPARLLKSVSDEMITWKTEGTAIYQKLPVQCFETLKECIPLTEQKVEIAIQEQLYKNWHQQKSKE